MGGLEIYVQVFLTSAQIGDKQSVKLQSCFISGKGTLGFSCKEAWVGARIFFMFWSRENCLLLLVTEIKILGRPPRSLGLTPTEQSQIL